MPLQSAAAFRPLSHTSAYFSSHTSPHLPFLAADNLSRIRGSAPEHSRINQLQSSLSCRRNIHRPSGQGWSVFAVPRCVTSPILFATKYLSATWVGACECGVWIWSDVLDLVLQEVLWKGANVVASWKVTAVSSRAFAPCLGA